ncbi:undecaprenyl-diphosphate phosphatase [Actinomycetospora endophytica]|uniref:Undecaprenyl-diphosphatase n=1 Tax=Actinomycetospora endophytica TaxID=2291215 RepID=A0ABS8PCE1_9PSEU|nr:undecaprenyl-diphosphate phosphatase [Actinomycetospora endophytica]MCD2195916.1 undecaprenyl-diphosphate phosphatase [Actinomycetospora endophytica]
MSAHLSWLEAAVIGALQGVAELFPVSSLGHSILLPAVIGGSWARDLDVSAPDSPYLAFIVGLHVATAIAMIIYFWRDWIRILRGLATSIRERRVETADERLAWLLVIATIPVGLAGLVLDHLFRTLLAKPIPTAAFLVINGVLLIAVEGLTRRRAAAQDAGSALEAPTVRLDARPDAPTQVMRSGSGVGVAPARTAGEESDARVAKLPLLTAVLVGAAQILALLPGISRSGATIGAGLLSKLSHEDAARFAFLLATPVILAAGVLKVGDLIGPAGDGIRGQVLLGSVLSGVGAYISVRFLTRYFEHRSMRPFGVYCIVAGAACLAWFTLS